MKKLLLLLIAACMLITCFACGDGNKKPHRVEPGTGEKWAALPDDDFGGADFRISTRGRFGAKEVVVDDESSENIIDLALMLRNAMVEDRYMVSIERQDNDGTMGVHINQVLTACTQLLDQFDLAMTYVFESSPLITNGFVLNWNELPYNKLEQTHWISGMNKEFSVRDAIYTTISKMCISTIGQTAAMVYNRDLGDETWGEEFSTGLFETIYDGDWTYDELMRIVNDFGHYDDDGSGDRSSGDSFGMFLPTDWTVDTWHAAWDLPIIKNSVENGLENVYMNEKLVSFVNRMHTMYYETPEIFGADLGQSLSAFMSNRTLFTITDLESTLHTLSNMESTYTIIPQPKYDENQEDYRSAMFDNYSVMSIPITADPDFVSLIVEALSIASEMHVYTAYKSDALQGQVVSDVDSMFDMILDNTAWDIATLLCTQVQLVDLARRDVFTNPGNSQIRQSYDAIAEDIDTALEEIMEAFDAFREN